MLWQVASHWISGKGPPTEGTVGLKVLRWQGVTKLEEDQAAGVIHPGMN